MFVIDFSGNFLECISRIFEDFGNKIKDYGCILGDSGLDLNRNTPSRWAPDEVMENSFIRRNLPGATGILNQVLPLLFDFFV
jgi:hypothetical protein